MGVLGSLCVLLLIVCSSRLFVDFMIFGFCIWKLLWFRLGCCCTGCVFTICFGLLDCLVAFLVRFVLVMFVVYGLGVLC